MPMTVNILIGGLAICYRKNDFWNIVFICDDVHPANFKDSETGRTRRLHEIGADANISFDLGGSSSVSAPEEGPGFTTIFNMAAKYAHGGGELRLSRSGTTDALKMKVPSAKLGAYSQNDRDYWVQDIGDGTVIGAPVEIIGQVAHIVIATFEVERDMVMLVTYTMSGGGTHPQPIAIPFQYVDGKTLTLEFDNDCREHCKGNDFVDLYDWVEDRDAQGKKRKFVAGKVKGELLNSQQEVNRQKSEEISAAKSMLSSLQGNCDPVLVDPPPGD